MALERLHWNYGKGYLTVDQRHSARSRSHEGLFLHKVPEMLLANEVFTPAHLSAEKLAPPILGGYGHP
jgi:hypothetical protein